MSRSAPPIHPILDLIAERGVSPPPPACHCLPLSGSATLLSYHTLTPARPAIRCSIAPRREMRPCGSLTAYRTSTCRMYSPPCGSSESTSPHPSSSLLSTQSRSPRLTQIAPPRLRNEIRHTRARRGYLAVASTERRVILIRPQRGAPLGGSWPRSPPRPARTRQPCGTPSPRRCCAAGQPSL